MMLREFAAESSTPLLESARVLSRNGLCCLFYKHRNGTRQALADPPLRFTETADRFSSPALAAEVFPAEHRWYLTHCSRDLKNLEHRWSDRTRGLYRAGQEWEDQEPRVAPFAPAPGT